jgi:hypothetical protein
MDGAGLAVALAQNASRSQKYPTNIFSGPIFMFPHRKSERYWFEPQSTKEKLAHKGM